MHFRLEPEDQGIAAAMNEDNACRAVYVYYSMQDAELHEYQYI